MPNLIMGIDPGQSGAYCIIDKKEGWIQRLENFKVIGEGKNKELDISDFVSTIMLYQPSLIVIEKVHAMPKQGVSSTFKFGVNYGTLIGAIKTLGYPMDKVTPQAWKKIVLVGYTPGDKSNSIKYCKDHYPHIDLTRTERSKKDDDNKADALCIAIYGTKL